MKHRILHIDFSGPWTEGMTYQENLLPDAMAMDGNEVYIFVPCYCWEEGHVEKVRPEEKVLESGVVVQRFEFTEILGNKFLSNKVRKVLNLEKHIAEINPDLILLHCVQTAAVKDICHYVKTHPSTILVADTHSDYNNSSTNFLSHAILHRLFYKKFAREVNKIAKYIYYITPETKRFLIQEYGLDDSKLKLLPLGGFSLSDDEYYQKRKSTREKFGVEDNQILFVHSGKIDTKKRTDVLIRAFLQAHADNAKLLIAGSKDGEYGAEIDSLLYSDGNSNGSVEYIGWKSGDELTDMLCAADVYCQPGSQSATLQNSICCRCACIVYPHDAYTFLFSDCSLFAKDEADLTLAIQRLAQDANFRTELQNAAALIAKEQLDYTMQGRRIIADCMN